MDNLEWRWALVGNIVESHPYGEAHELRYGTKQFVPGTKVYVANPGRLGPDKAVVIGKTRKSFNYIKIIINSKLIENYRIQKVFKPAILAKMKSTEGWGWYEDNSLAGRIRVIKRLSDFNPEAAKKEYEIIIAEGKVYSDIKEFCLRKLRTFAHCYYGQNVDNEKLLPRLTPKEFKQYIEFINYNFHSAIEIEEYSDKAMEKIYKRLFELELYDNYYCDFYFYAERLGFTT